MAYSPAESSDNSFSWDQIGRSLNRTRDKTSLDTYAFDSVEIDYSMPSDTLASTHYRRGLFGNSTTLKVNSAFPYLSDHDQDLVVTHEAIHANMYNNKLDSQLYELGLSEESRIFINSNFNRDADSLEGATQLLTENLYPDMEKTSLNIYPGRTKRIERKANSRGLDFAEELGNSRRNPVGPRRQRKDTSFQEIGDFLSGLNNWFTGPAS